MVYSLELLNSEEELSAQGVSGPCPSVSASPYNPTTSRIVSVLYNGQRIEDIAGPTPFVEFSSSVERTETGMPQVINNKIVLTGKVVRTGNPSSPLSRNYGSGIIPVMDGVNRLQKLFKCNDCGTLAIECIPGGGGGYNPLFMATGVRVVDFSFEKSDDNWTMTADYTVTLEYLEPSYKDRYIRSYSDSWNIEQLEDYTYIYNLDTVTQKAEWDNPNAIGVASSPQTQNTTGANTIGSTQLTNFSIPRYKVSRTISAIGIPSGTGYCGGANVIDPYDSSYTLYEMDAFLNAKNWVEARAASILPPANRPQTPNDQKPPLNLMWSPLSSGYLYNRVRSVRFDIQEASYEITDTYLAMPTGIGYTEDYTIEISTDNKYVHTVRVNGEIKGLSVSQANNITQSNLNITGSNSINSNTLEVNLALGLDTSVNIGTPQKRVPDLMSGVSKANIITDNRYTNALNGWIYDVKPYLYRRACAAMQSADRTKGYINPTQFAAGRPPNNPVYSRHGVLNIIPISTTEGHDRRKGIISYSHEFNNKFTIISGAIYESVSINTNGPADVIAEAFVLGRQLGPILQDLGSKTSSKKSISIEVGVVPPSTVNGYFLNHQECPLWTGGSVYKTIDTLVEGVKPYGDRDVGVFGGFGVRKDVEGRVFVSQDDHSWNPSEGVYSRNVAWVYQPCTNKQSYLDN